MALCNNLNGWNALARSLFFCWSVYALFRICSEINRQVPVRFIYTFSYSSQNCTCREPVPSKPKWINNWNSTRSGRKILAALKISLLNKKIQFKCLKNVSRKTAPSQLKRVKRQLEHSEESEGKQKKCLRSKKKKNNNYRRWQSTLRTLSELCYPSGFICPQAEQKRAQKTILQGFFKSEFVATLSWNSSVLVSQNMPAQHARSIMHMKISLTQHWASLYIYLGCWHSWNFFCWCCHFFCGTSE